MASKLLTFLFLSIISITFFSEKITKNIPPQKEGEEILFNVKCFGPCKYVEVKIKVKGDADLFVR